jgi:hypothetical protein
MAAARKEYTIARKTGSKAFVEGEYAVFNAGGARGEVLVKIHKLERDDGRRSTRPWLTGFQVNTKDFSPLEWNVPLDEAEPVTKEEGKRIADLFNQ